MTFQPTDPDQLIGWIGERHHQAEPFTTSYQAQDSAQSDLSMVAFNQVCFFHPQDLVVGVEAAMPFQKLNQILAEKNCHLPVSPWFEGTTVGQVLLQNQYGPQRMERGGIRDFVIGAQFVNGTAKLIKTGGQVVKNVTGYDLAKLMIGSRGGFGVLLTVNFKVMPSPVGPRSLFFTMRGNQWTTWVRDELLARSVPLDWFQAVFKQGVWQLGMGISGIPERQRRLVSDLQSIFDNQLILSDDSREPQRFRSLGREHRLAGFLSPHINAIKSPPFHIHGVAPTSSFLKKERILSQLTGLDVTLVCHPMGGDIHILGPLHKLNEEVMDQIRRAFAGSKGYLTLETVTPEILQSFGYSVPLPSEYPLMQHLKRTLDPKGIFKAPFYEMV